MSATYDKTVRSKESLESARVIIFNRTKRPVQILWINYDAITQLYRILRPGEQLEINTYKTHPWIFRDYWTGMSMHVNHQEVFWPEASTDKHPVQHVHIHFPVQSLKEISSWAIVVKARDFKEITQMEIPETLRNDLGPMFRNFHIHHVMLEHSRSRMPSYMQRRLYPSNHM